MSVSIVTMQAAESKHAAAVESLKEGWVAELKRQKEAWAAAEKARRDTWLADKTKQVKELTVKVSSSLCAYAVCNQTPLVLPPFRQHSAPFVVWESCLSPHLHTSPSSLQGRVEMHHCSYVCTHSAMSFNTTPCLWLIRH